MTGSGDCEHGALCLLHPRTAPQGARRPFLKRHGDAYRVRPDTLHCLGGGRSQPPCAGVARASIQTTGPSSGLHPQYFTSLPMVCNAPGFLAVLRGSSPPPDPLTRQSVAAMPLQGHCLRFPTTLDPKRLRLANWGPAVSIHVARWRASAAGGADPGDMLFARLGRLMGNRHEYGEWAVCTASPCWLGLPPLTPARQQEGPKTGSGCSLSTTTNQPTQFFCKTLNPSSGIATRLMFMHMLSMDRPVLACPPSSLPAQLGKQVPTPPTWQALRTWSAHAPDSCTMIFSLENGRYPLPAAAAAHIRPRSRTVLRAGGSRPLARQGPTPQWAPTNPTR